MGAPGIYCASLYLDGGRRGPSALLASARQSNQVLADAGADQVDGDHGDNHDNDLRRRLGILKAADAFIESLADAASADDTERGGRAHVGFQPVERERDRKSTRLNSSHLGISYAVFCLKK